MLPRLGADLDVNGNDILMGNQSVKFGTSKWEIVLDTGDNDLLFKYNNVTVFTAKNHFLEISFIFSNIMLKLKEKFNDRN